MRRSSIGFGLLGLLVALSLLLGASEAAASPIVPVSQARAVFTNLVGYGPATVISPDDTASGFGAFSGYSSKTAQQNDPYFGYRSGTVTASQTSTTGPGRISVQGSASLDLIHTPVNPADDSTDFAVAQSSYSLDFHLASDATFSAHVLQTATGTPTPVGLLLSFTKLDPGTAGVLPFQGFLTNDPSFVQTGILPAGDYRLEVTETRTQTTVDNYAAGPRHFQQSAGFDVLLAVPEPGTGWSLSLGLAALAVNGARRRLAFERSSEEPGFPVRS